METPLAFQVRGGRDLVVALGSALDEVAHRIEDVDAKFHDETEARHAFDYGFSVFRQGEVPVTCMVHRRAVSLMLGGRQVGGGPVALEALRAAVTVALAPAKKPKK